MFPIEFARWSDLNSFASITITSSSDRLMVTSSTALLIDCVRLANQVNQPKNGTIDKEGLLSETN